MPRGVEEVLNGGWDARCAQLFCAISSKTSDPMNLMHRWDHVDPSEKDSLTPLMCAAQSGHAGTLTALVKASDRLDHVQLSP